MVETGSLSAFATIGKQFVGSAEMGDRASPCMTTLCNLLPNVVSAPLWVLLALVERELGEFQRFALLPVLLTSLSFLAFILLTGAVTIF